MATDPADLIAHEMWESYGKKVSPVLARLAGHIDVCRITRRELAIYERKARIGKKELRRRRGAL